MKKTAIQLGSLAVLLGIVFMVAGDANCVVKREKRMVRGESLHGILEDGEEIQLLIGYYNCHEVERGDIVAFKHVSNGEAPIIKIAYGIPGDTWDIKPGSRERYLDIYVNGEQLKTVEGVAYGLFPQQAKLLQLYIKDRNGVIPKDSYLLLSTHPGGGNDSTHWGLIGRRSLVGKVR